MKRHFIAPLLLALAALMATGCQKDPVEPQQERQSIVILFENDVHCAINGYARIAGLRDAIADTAWAALVSSGDYLQGAVTGAISHGQYIVDIMRTMRYDAVELGNHEFDYGVPRLQELFAGFNAPVLCCNLFDMQGHRLYDAYTIRTYGDRRVAFVGVLTPQTELSNERYSFYDSLDVQHYTLRQNEYTMLVQQAVDAARAEGADYVVLLSHLGEDAYGNPFNSNDLIAATHGINAVLDAHTHSIIDTVITNSEGDPVLLANTGAAFAKVGKLYIGPDGQMDITLIPTEQISQVSSTVNAAVEQVKQAVNEQVGQIVGQSEVPILITDGNGTRLVRKAETNAGDLTADAIRWLTDAQIGLSNGGGIRVDLPAGDITYGDIMSLLPFDNLVWKIEATGAQILEMLRVGTANLPGESGDFPQVSGLRYTATVADHSISNVEVLQADGSYLPLDPSATYTIGTYEYTVTGGGFGGSLSSCTVLSQSSTLYRDALVQYIATALGGTIGQQYAAPQGRITIVQ